MPSKKFEETIIYKTHQHWITFVLHMIKVSAIIGIPVTILVIILSSDWIYGLAVFATVAVIVFIYEHFLHSKSWLIVGNDKLTMFVRNGLFSQYAMSIRYKNIQDCACSKNSMLGYALGYGTFFARSVSGKDGEHFQANYVPKVGKVYSIVNALANLSDEERNNVQDLEHLFALHSKEPKIILTPNTPINNFIGSIDTEVIDPITEGRKRILSSIPGVIEVVALSSEDRRYIATNEEKINEGVIACMKKESVFVLTHDSIFRDPDDVIVSEKPDRTKYFPIVPFHELGPSAISGSPGIRIHAYLVPKFEKITTEYATIVVGI